MDTPALRLLTGFLKATESTEMIDIFLSVTQTQNSTELYSVRETIRGGQLAGSRKITFEKQVKIQQADTSILQYRKANIDRTRTPSEETQRMRRMVIDYLHSQKYVVVGRPNREAVVEHLHAEELKSCDVLHVSDSYGVQGYNGFTTTNHCGLALPGASVAVVLGVAERLCLEHATNASTLVIQAGTNDFLTLHNGMVDQLRRQGTPLNDQAAIDKGLNFGYTLHWDTSRLIKERPNLKCVVVAPLSVHMLDITPSENRKAHLLQMFNLAAARAMKQRDTKGLNTYRVITLPGIWYLSTDEVHLRPYQTPLMLYHIQEELKTNMGLKNDFIDSPRAVATYYTRGHRTFERIAAIGSVHTRTKMMKSNHDEEMRCVKLAMTPKRTKSLDACQTPAQCNELILGNKGMLIEWTEWKKLGECRGSPRPSTDIPPQCPVKQGSFEKLLANTFLNLEKTLSESEFHILIQKPMKEVLTQDRVELNAIGTFDQVIKSNQGWNEYIQEQEALVEEKIVYEPAEKPKGRSGSKFKASRITYLDIPYKDWVMMSRLFKDFEKGPNVFWSSLTTFSQAQMNTIMMLLEITTVKYIARGKVGMDKLIKAKATLRSQMSKWIRGQIQETEGGGICQAELEIMTGLHTMHLTTILSSNVITLLQGRKNQEPASTPKSWRKGDQGILYLPRYLEGTLYQPETTKIKQVIALEEITWDEAGLPNDCNAVTETEKNINLLAKYFGTRGEARRIARVKTNTTFDSASTTSVEQASDSASNQNPGVKGKTLEYKGEMITFMDDMPQCSSTQASGSRDKSTIPKVGSTRRIRTKRHQVNQTTSATRMKMSRWMIIHRGRRPPSHEVVHLHSSSRRLTLRQCR